MGILLKNLKKKTMSAFVSDIVNANNYYTFMGKTSSWGNELAPDKENEAIKASLYDTRKDMLIGKKILADDTAYLIKKNKWSSNTVYAQYSNIDDELYSKTFFVVNINNDIYKCLYNNGNDFSIVEPTSVSYEPFTLADGYTWKYMYSLSPIDNLRFGTNEYIPVDTNSFIVSNAVKGSIDIITIEFSGSGYQQASGTVQEVSNTFSVYRIDTSHPSSNGYFNSSSFYINTGTGQGELRTINSYVSNATGRYVVLDSSNSATTLDATSQYIIGPQIQFTGNGSGAKAVATVDVNGGISSVTIIDTGSGYDYCDITIAANTAFGSGANVYAIIPPPGGHGSDPVVELGSERLCISVDVDNNEANTVNTAIEFRQVGIIQNIRYSNNAIYDEDTFDLTINTPLVNRFSGDVLYFDNVTAIHRSNTATETVRLIIKF